VTPGKTYRIRAFKTELKEILPIRALFLAENNFQIRYNACHERNWSDSYLLTADEVRIGYGSVKGKEELSHRDAVFEFFVISPFRKMASLIFSELLATSGASFIECQTNDTFLTSLFFEFSQNIGADVIVFEDAVQTEYQAPGVIFRRFRQGDPIFDHRHEPKGEYVLEKEGEIIATGGFLLHYNMPFADLYMEVKENFRRMGFGSFIIQELKRECYLSGRVPAARCNIENIASKATLIKAGLRPCGFMLNGDIKKQIQK
jgi:hypothetical protein